MRKTFLLAAAVVAGLSIVVAGTTWASPASTSANLISQPVPSDGNPEVVSTGYGQVTMYNKTNMTLDLYVDGNYGCRALKNLMCTCQVKAGTHTLVAKAANGQSISHVVTINSGDSFTWTITQE